MLSEKEAIISDYFSKREKPYYVEEIQHALDQLKFSLEEALRDINIIKYYVSEIERL